jgi:hypothetical protein
MEELTDKKKKAQDFFLTTPKTAEIGIFDLNPERGGGSAISEGDESRAFESC